MKDLVQAGRWFFLCESSHPKAQECIALFVARCGRRHEQVLGQLPGVVRRQVREGKAHSCVIRRLEGLGMIPNAAVRIPTPTTRWQRTKEFMSNAGIALGCLSVIICALVGIVMIASWILAWLRPGP
jgi:hypothetical protein